MTSPLPHAPTDPPDNNPASTPAAPAAPITPRLVPALAIAPGTVVVDECTARVGEVRGSEGPYLQLRPLGGGREWDADPARVRPATDTERLRAAVAAANTRSRRIPPHTTH